MRAGSAVVFSSDLMHRTAPNAAGSAASVLQTVWMASDDGLLPRQLSYHLPDGELGKWNLQRIIELRDGDEEGVGRASTSTQRCPARDRAHKPSLAPSPRRRPPPPPLPP
eukprot:scaffold28188_cov66-Phaeocystis_antarctica.AAC.12